MKRSVISKDNETKPDELDYKQEKKRKRNMQFLWSKQLKRIWTHRPKLKQKQIIFIESSIEKYKKNFAFVKKTVKTKIRFFFNEISEQKYTIKKCKFWHE
jgi:hypothetical protein